MVNVVVCYILLILGGYRVKYRVSYCTLWTPGSFVHCLFCKISTQALALTRPPLHPIHPLHMHVYLIDDKFSFYNLKMANICGRNM